MEIKFLSPSYKNNEEIYLDFIKGKIDFNKQYFSEQSVYINEAPDFPIYLHINDEDQREKAYMQAFKTISDSYLELDREIHMDGTFWHSLLIGYKRDYILYNYPQVRDSMNVFKKIVTRNFDWENYIFKCVIGAEFVEDATDDTELKDYYYKLIIQNLDLYNYLIKSELFRNGDFILKVLTVVDELNISQIMKAKIENRPDLGKDERYGRRVVYELNKEYPVIMAPILTVDELKIEILRALELYGIDNLN